MYIRAYLRASTKEQDVTRAESSLIEFIESQGLDIASIYRENESGRVLARPELNRLIADSSQGDIILVESIDRLTRLKQQDWKALKSIIEQKHLSIVAQDLPTSHQALDNSDQNDLTQGILDAINGMLIEILAVMAAKDYEQRRARAKQGMLKARKLGKLNGRPIDKQKHAAIKKLLINNLTYTQILACIDCSRTTIARVSREMQPLSSKMDATAARVGSKMEPLMSKMDATAAKLNRSISKYIDHI